MKSCSQLFTSIRVAACNFPKVKVLSLRTMTVNAASSDCIAPARRQPKRAWRVAVLTLIVAMGGVVVALWLRPAPPRFELITSDDYQRRTKRFAFIQDARAWMTRFSPKIFGFARVE